MKTWRSWSDSVLATSRPHTGPATTATSICTLIYSWDLIFSDFSQYHQWRLPHMRKVEEIWVKDREYLHKRCIETNPGGPVCSTRAFKCIE